MLPKVRWNPQNSRKPYKFLKTGDHFIFYIEGLNVHFITLSAIMQILILLCIS